MYLCTETEATSNNDWAQHGVVGAEFVDESILGQIPTQTNPDNRTETTREPERMLLLSAFDEMCTVGAGMPKTVFATYGYVIEIDEKVYLIDMDHNLLAIDYKHFKAGIADVKVGRYALFEGLQFVKYGQYHKFAFAKLIDSQSKIVLLSTRVMSSPELVRFHENFSKLTIWTTT